MSKFAAAARRFVRDETGATMAEYALLITVVALVALVGARSLGTSLSNKFTSLGTTITTP